MGLIIRPGGSGTPVATADDAIRHLRLPMTEGAEEVVLIDGLIAAATDFYERECRIAITRKPFTLTVDSWPRDRMIQFPKPPLISVSEVRYVDPAGQSQVLAANTYTVDTTSKPGRLSIKPSLSWPAIMPVPACISIDYAAGYETVPQLLKQGVLLLVGHWYANREATSDRRVNDVPLAVESIIDLHKFPGAV